MQDFRGEKSVLVGRDFIIGENETVFTGGKQRTYRLDIEHVMRIQALQISLLLIVLIMLIVGNVRDDAADANRQHLQSTLDMHIMISNQKK